MRFIGNSLRRFWQADVDLDHPIGPDGADATPLSTGHAKFPSGVRDKAEIGVHLIEIRRFYFLDSVPAARCDRLAVADAGKKRNEGFTYSGKEISHPPA
jgi:hypothetical protein